jgi:AcrR family transcriptional regulator
VTADDPAKPTTRERIVTATGELFRRQGYHGTSLKQVTTASAAPFGSLYHHFPGGKQALAAEVIATSGQAYQDLFELIYDAAPDPATAITDFFDGAAAVLEQTDYIDACPIGTIALEVASTDDVLRGATHEVFSAWQASATGRLVADGIPEAGAQELATALVAAVEGGFMLSRAARSPEPMRTSGRLLRQLVEAAVDHARLAATS